MRWVGYFWSYLPMLLLFGMAVALLVAVAMTARLLGRQRRKAREFGYPSLGAYLRAAPRTDEERRDAADLALKGLVICILGLIVPPLLLLGLFPFFYGVRKLVWSSMGLGLLDDADGSRPEA